MKLNEIYNENCLETLKRFSDSFLHLVITSPPYDTIRTYNDNIDESWCEAIWKPIIKELYRVMVDGGVVVWVVGDAVHNGSETGSSFKQALHFQEVGFKIHDTMLYEKNGAAFPAKRNGNRYTQIFEYMFIFSKGKPRVANLICDKKNRWAGTTTFGKASYRNKDGVLIEKKQKPVPDFSPRNNIWKYNTGKNYSTKDAIAFEHPAIFPEALAKDHILTWSNEGDIVYDPFMGSGTTAKMALLSNRKYIGSELSSDYIEIANKRLKQYKNKLF